MSTKYAALSSLKNLLALTLQHFSFDMENLLESI